jgi:1-deoxyxylulose-5-phosphate synthase
MKKRPLGKTGIQVSEIAFGGVEIGLPYGIGVESEADMLTETEAIALLQAALEAGINFFDTARMYGSSETIMGKAFADRRNKVVLASKCRHFRDSAGQLPDESQLEQFIQTSLRESLVALQTDYLDLYLLHQADEEILENETIARVFSRLKASGVVRATGVSTYKPEETKLAIDKGSWDVIQLPFNLMDQRQEALFSAAAQAGVGIVIRSVLMKGLLSDRGQNLHPALKEVEAHLQQYGELLGETTPDLPTLATKFALSFGDVSSVLVGIDRQEYLHKSLNAADGAYLDAKSKRQAQALAYPDPGFLNLPHWSRMGWLK